MTSDHESGFGHVLRWSLRSSFREYVAALQDGEEEVREGAAIDHEGRFAMHSDPAPGDTPNDDLVLTFRGTVSFRGHGGILAVELENPWIHLSQDGGGTVSLVVRQGLRGGRRRSVIASFDEARRVHDVLLIGQPRMTSAGVAMLGDVYQPGDLFDPIEIQMNVMREHGANEPPPSPF